MGEPIYDKYHRHIGDLNNSGGGCLPTLMSIGILVWLLGLGISYVVHSITSAEHIEHGATRIN
jgi:hypothetical protein